jgi:hypothetical protein
VLRVKAGIFSFTPPNAPDDDGSYLRWHLLDHQPEQYQLPGIVYALRWIADRDYVHGRIAGSGPLADVGNVVNYLVGDPVQQTLEDFTELGARLAEVGRFPEIRPSLQLSVGALQHWYAAPQALISPAVVPFRPHRGVIVIVEQPTDRNTAEWLQWLHTDHFPELLTAPGVAGAWMFGSTATWKTSAQWNADQQYVTVIYLDEDPLQTTRALTGIIEQRWSSGAARPLFAGPLRTMLEWEAWPKAT